MGGKSKSLYEVNATLTFVAYLVHNFCQIYPIELIPFSLYY